MAAQIPRAFEESMLDQRRLSREPKVPGYVNDVIVEMNARLWQSRYMFHPDFLGTMAYVLGQIRPRELPLEAFQGLDLQMPLALQGVRQQLSDNFELQKFAVLFFLAVVVRVKNRSLQVAEFLPLVKRLV